MLKIVKIGGNIVDNSVKLQAFLADFAALDGDKILVHGGGKVATAISAALGIDTVMIEGRRVTDARTLEVVTMVYNGINKQIVSSLQGLGCNAVGLCGADGGLVVSRKRSPQPVDYGFVGDPVSVNTCFIQQLAAHGYALVIAPITFDGGAGECAGLGARIADSADAVDDAGGAGRIDGDADTADSADAVGDTGDTGDAGGANRLLNTNADTVAQTIATAMAEAGAEVELVYCFEKQGVLADVNDENSVVPRIDAARFAELKAAGAVHSGMLPKLENAFRAIGCGVGSVVICAAENILQPGYGGTTIV